MGFTEINDELYELVSAKKSEGDNFQMKHKYIKAVEKFEEAIELLPKPHNQWKYMYVLLGSVQENYWLNAQFNEGKGGGYEEALDVFEELMKMPFAIGKARYHLRIGQLRYELGQVEKAKDELMRAFLIEGNDIFRLADDTKYFKLIQPIIEAKQDVTYTKDEGTYQFD